MESQIKDKIQDAWNLASVAHQDQYYVNADGIQLPYINHIGAVVQEVYMYLLDGTDDLDTELLLICAILHDTLEDTSITYKFIIEKFGPGIAEGVLALTKDKSISSKSEKMDDSLDRILKQPREIAIVKMADRIVNLQPPPKQWPKDKRQEYLDEAVKLYHALKIRSTRFSARLWSKIEMYHNYL